MYLPFCPRESVGRKGQIHCVSARPLVPREGLYQIRGQSLNTHQGKHRSGGAQTTHKTLKTLNSLTNGGGLLYLRLGLFTYGWSLLLRFGLFCLRLLLRFGLFYLRLVFVTSVWSFLLTVEIRFGLFYLRLKFGLVFFAYGGKSVWSFLLTVSQLVSQRKRDDNKNNICVFKGGGGQGDREENCPKRYFSWETSWQ